ncbi:putative lipoprotein [Bathymodiolus platifrons methanotrophic gill symbiont]|uniref:YbaY family lipoprotein n=1 Tax=Bathymodiolus platifrons methanotrophic gill symbiont TaxID=113268 RepID=UPI000B40C61B|nr:YbaY family lipoprotein [Bathymodiolus platifrons methanotrophic gill symbiont]MCK5870882.1 YbaY family lipoprotein [Methyloprofundus sp.]TXK97042.1 lipo-like protein [Methylococcaceae bacterium CS4]TXK99384.1 lipo-like protein [Methylococcaceae bacterium CS5]TXL05023.1 lipo-like protein [Methylococcaceae bacterium CS1]TXL05465.1 lipo-like protein [Methylococcaceae bacterium CS3]TXL09999.1 lipo-like protein [Methylococcaceae bacterium CS2]TXL14929.1 lipo-like protein [Methylococcaceae bac
MKITSVLKYFVVLLISITSNILAAEENILTGSAYYLERILLPENAVFEATLEDVSLMDVPAVILGSVTIEPAGQIPIYFAIKYNADDIKLGHHYNVRGKITVDGKLKFITDTMHPVLSRKDSGELKLKMIRLQTAKKKK